MATKTNTTEQKTFTLAPEFSLWKRTTKNGNKPYFTGKTEDGRYLVGFYNTKKKNPKEPDLRVYFQGNSGEEINDKVGYAIWHNVNEKTGKEYFSGVYFDENENTPKLKIVGFKSKSNSEKAPALNFFTRVEKEDKPGNVFEEQAKQNSSTDDNDELPFFI